MSVDTRFDTRETSATRVARLRISVSNIDVLVMSRPFGASWHAPEPSTMIREK
jgi:hypothetical protein